MTLSRRQSLRLLAGAATAQEQRSGGFLDNLFSRGEPPSGGERQAAPQTAQSDAGDLSVRLDRMENALRQLTGSIEQDRKSTRLNSSH